MLVMGCLLWFGWRGLAASLRPPYRLWYTRCGARLLV